MQAPFHKAIQTVCQVLVGKDHQVRLAVCALLAKGHLLIEDIPGVGKTTLSQALSTVLGLQHQRVQFTSDLLPSDIVGTTIFNRESNAFELHKGAVFTEVLLADEVNRATPKTQSALLEAMAERQVTIDGVTHNLAESFFVIATQNPERHGGTFPLPESQLDRFMMRLTLGYPDPAAEKAILLGKAGVNKIATLQSVLTPAELLSAHQQVLAVRLSDAVLGYIQRLIAKSRKHDDISVGLSPRAALSLVHAAQAWAWMDEREYLIPEDVQAVFSVVTSHRLRDANYAVPSNDGLARHLLEQVGVLE